jgi:hypothetical protein
VYALTKTGKLDLVSISKFVLFEFEIADSVVNGNYKQKSMTISVVAHRPGLMPLTTLHDKKGRLGGYSWMLGDQNTHDRVVGGVCAADAFVGTEKEER